MILLDKEKNLGEEGKNSEGKNVNSENNEPRETE